MPGITIYTDPDGLLTIDYPEGMPENEALERAYEAVQRQRKSPSACANMQKGSTENGAVVGHSDSTVSAAKSQEGGKQK